MKTRRRHTPLARAGLRVLAPFVLASLASAAFALVGARVAGAITTVPPTMSVSIAGAPLSPNGTATATVKIVSGTKGTFAYTWTVNGTPTRTLASSTATTDKLPLAGLSYGDVVAVTATPLAGTLAGKPATDSVTLTNHAPTAKLTFAASPGTATAPRPNGTAKATATTADADGDGVILTFEWKIDGDVKRTFSSTTATSDS